MGFGAEMIVRRQNKVVKRFLKLKAVNKENAITYEKLNIKESRTFKNLLKENVIIEFNNKYYLSEKRWENFRKSLKRFFLF